MYTKNKVMQQCQSELHLPTVSRSTAFTREALGTPRSNFKKKNVKLSLNVAPYHAAGPEPMVLDLRIVHDRFGSSSDPSLSGHLHYPYDIDKSLNEVATDKIRKYRPDCKNNLPNVVSFIPAIVSTSGRLHSEFIRLLFLQAHRETDLFFADSGVQIT
jgi:hypothetical protein